MAQPFTLLIKPSGSDCNVDCTYCFYKCRAPQVGTGRQRMSDEVLERLADYTENRQNLQQKVLLAFIYPALVTLVAAAVVIGLLVYVVPQVTRVFENTGQTLPVVTRILIAVSDFARGGGWWWLIVIVAGIFAFRVALREPHLRRRWHHLLLRLPLVGRLLRGTNAARRTE